MYSLGRTVCSWPAGSLVCLWDEQADCWTEVPRLMPIRQKKAIEFVYCSSCFCTWAKKGWARSWPLELLCDCSPTTFSFCRWRCFIAPMWWHLLWSFSRVWAWSKGCCSFSSQTPETNKGLFVLPCICTDAAVPLLLQICNHSKLQLCGKYIKTWENMLLCIFFGIFCFGRGLVSSILCTYLILSSIYSGSTCNHISGYITLTHHESVVIWLKWYHAFHPSVPLNYKSLSFNYSYYHFI